MRPRQLALVLCLAALLPALLPGLLSGRMLAAAPPDRPAAAADVEEYLAYGAELYAWNCAVCHGATGGGLAEAKLAFPADHRNCTRCHRPSNRVVQPLDQPFDDHDMFSLGDPPALHEGVGADAQAALASVAPPDVLFAYIAATMPRYDPGRLSEQEYWALTAFLLDLNGRPESVAEVVGAR